MRKRLIGILACVVLVSASCQAASPSLAPPGATEAIASTGPSAIQDSNLASDQILRVSIDAEPESLDATVLGAPSILRALQRPLIDFDEHGDFVSGLAESWEISDDAKTLTFHLRDARYSNGERIVAGDFVNAARRLADPRLAAGYSGVMAQVVGGPELVAMAGADLPSDADIRSALANLGVSAPDDRTFTVELVRPSVPFLSDLTLWFFAPLPEAWMTAPNATEAGNFLSSGPFMLDTWEHESRLVLKPNPFWWGEVKPALTEIQMLIRAPAEAQLAYEAGEIDIVRVPNEDIQRVRSDPILGAQYREAPRLGVNFYCFNNFQDPRAASYGEPGPTANRDFRIALTQAIDKQALIDATWAGLGEVANSIIMPGIPGHQPDLNPYPFDLVSARQHMDTALAALGVPSAADLRDLNLRLVPDFDSNGPRAAFLAEAWRQAFGLDVEQVGSDRGAFFDDRTAGRYDVVPCGWGADYPHAGNQLNGLFTCRGGNNDSKYCNPAFDALVALAEAERSADKQAAIYQEAQAILMNDTPILPLRFNVASFAVKPYVSGLAEHPSDVSLGDYYYETIQILKH